MINPSLRVVHLLKGRRLALPAGHVALMETEACFGELVLQRGEGLLARGGIDVEYGDV